MIPGTRRSLMYADQRTVMKNVQLVGVLERMCQELELTDIQFELAKSRYEGVGRWFADAEDPLISMIAIYLQGSTAIGTTVKPIASYFPAQNSAWLACG